MSLPDSGDGTAPADGTTPAEPGQGSGRPFPDPEHSITPRRPRTVGGGVYLAVLAGTAGGLALIVLGPWRTGLTVIGGSMILGALGRLVIRDSSAGMLGVRRKFVDVATMAVLGAALCTLAVVIPDQPPL
jgi:hypothetical protein